MRNLLLGIVIGALLPIALAVAARWRIRRAQRRRELEQLRRITPLSP